ncbi:MAG: WGR domain-containing protein [Betaproteobacteria bacterium]|nr:WGR domain-containing protein [Betaproteobacteria bacterium]
MMSMEMYFERRNTARNEARYYRLSVERTLFGDWAVIREWGRIGRRGGQREHWCGSHGEAARLVSEFARERARRGYVTPAVAAD